MSSQAPNSPSRSQAFSKPEAAAAYPSSGALDEVSPFLYGTTRLGGAALPFAERVAMARRAAPTL